MLKTCVLHFPKRLQYSYVKEVEDEFSFGEKPTPKVEAAIPKMAESIVKSLVNRGWIKN